MYIYIYVAKYIQLYVCVCVCVRVCVCVFVCVYICIVVYMGAPTGDTGHLATVESGLGGPNCPDWRPTGQGGWGGAHRYR